MPLALRVNDGVVTKDRIAEGEAAQFEALKKAVLASEEQKRQEERERRTSQGLDLDGTDPGELQTKGSTLQRILGKLCFGA
jgi:hypothetical protein